MKNYIKRKVLEILGCDDVIVEIPTREGFGDFSIQCAPLRTDELKSPMDVANYIKNNFVDDNNCFDDIKIVGPYVNFYLNYDLYADKVIKEIEEQKENYGSMAQGNNKKLLIEHTSVNPNAEPHIGRARNSLIGDFLSNLYKFTGYDVERHYFINDVGKKIALLIVGIEKYGLSSDSFSEILDVYVKISKEAKENNLIENKAFEYLELVENGDEDTVKKFKDITDKCVQSQLKIFDQLGISFDVFTHESDYVYNDGLNEILNKLRNKNKLKEDELGRYYVDLSDYDIPTKNPVLVLTRSNKTSLYPLRDIAYTMYKMNLNSENNIIVLGEDQEVYMKQIAAVLDILNYKAPKLESYSYVLLEGEKMSTSGGTLVLVTDFIKAVNETIISEFTKRNTHLTEDTLQKLCNACIKFTMLNVSRKKIVNFNLENATSFTGESGIYILYSIVRINSILSNVDISFSDKIKYETDIEKKIVKELSLFPEVVNSLIINGEPSHLTKYVFNLTKTFSRFYEEVNIIKESDEVLKSSRVRLAIAVKTTLTNALSILGIETVEKM